MDVVVVTTNRRELVLECLAHLDDPAIDRVVVVVNASTDGTAEAVRRLFPNAELVQLAEEASLPRTNNAGAEVVTAPYVLFLNDDVLPVPGAITELAAELEEWPETVAIGGRLVDADTLRTQSQYLPRTFPTLSTFLVQLLDIERIWPSNPITRRHRGRSFSEQQVVEVDQPAGACLLVRRETLMAIGGFDERFWVWYEDVDLLRRLKRFGRILYAPKAMFRHLGAGSVGRWTQADIVRSRYQGILRYAEVHLSRPARACLAFIVAFVCLARVVAFTGRRPDVALAYRAAARAAVSLLRGREIPRLMPRASSTSSCSQA